MKKNILVTGAGALLGQGILRLLQIADFSKKIITADPDIRSTGHWLGDFAVTIPKATDANFMDVIKKLIVEQNIDAIMVGTDVELPIFSEYKNQLLQDFNCIVIVSNADVISIANDKFLTSKFLEDNNFPFPYSVMANDKEKLIEIEQKLGFPLFAKPIDGARSLGILKIENHQQLLDIYSPTSNLVVQQFLPDNEGEFTSGCVVINGVCKATVTLKRDLRDGNTYRAYVDENTSKYDEYISKIAEKLNPDGPVNFQFRIVDEKPIIFEINGRFSGTTPIRHFFGFNEVEAILNFHFFGKEIEKPVLKKGVVMRTWSDIFIDQEQYNSFVVQKTLDNPNPEFYNFSLK